MCIAFAIHRNAALEASLAAIPNGPARADGLAVGQEVAAKLLALRQDDRSNATVTYTPKTIAICKSVCHPPPVSSPTRGEEPVLPATVYPYENRYKPGMYQLTPPAFAPVVQPHWGGVTPFMLKGADQFRLAGPPAPHSAEFAKDLYEVQALGAKVSPTRTRNQTDAARSWTASAVGTDNEVARQLAANKGLSLGENARLFALLNMAGADALIACWHAKYRYHYWRPITAIRNADSAGNSGITPDPGWEPPLPTPAHPEYPSGRACYSGATVRVLREFFGDDISFSLTNPAVKVTRNFQSLAQMGQEVEDARVWGGIHYRTAVAHGSELGCNAAEYGLNHHLRPVGSSAGN